MAPTLSKTRSILEPTAARPISASLTNIMKLTSRIGEGGLYAHELLVHVLWADELDHDLGLRADQQPKVQRQRWETS